MLGTDAGVGGQVRWRVESAEITDTHEYPSNT
ncbi:hypothetical protein ckrop_1657 [Corynebacterium kroppenstedtii DSM 44385]|uniref:Uncharacterized protein n=1 Tax=Corynebacterium kroppenstedtii (strain DSM 44385 / JCM 11950 / CIP 105744 / CCUG 35717) TaxID=645127 RepID=C4LKM7_CORK4|nr:hypothetical protein ckrop_1657 [Corynebacterium kroppenstedtii DSM 44385]